MKKFIFFILCVLSYQFSIGQQNIGINTNSPDSSAILDIVSSDKGILIPRLSSVNRLDIDSPANGLMVYDITEDALFIYSDTCTCWNIIPNKSQLFWDIKNNNIYNLNDKNVGIGTDNPVGKLHIKGDTTAFTKFIISNHDSTYNIIVILDETEEGITFNGSNSGQNIKLFQALFNGNFGIGTTPDALLHLKPHNSDEAKIKISNSDSSYHIIVILDETEEGIVTFGNDNNVNKLLYKVDKIGQFGIGTADIKSLLHLFSDTVSPAIRLSKDAMIYDYVVGYGEDSDEFKIYRDTINGGQANVLSIDTSGDLHLSSINEVNIAPKLKTGSIVIENDSTGNSFSITANDDGSPSWSNGINYIDLYNNYSDTLWTTFTDIHWSIRNQSNNGFSSGLSLSNTTVTIDNAGTYEIIYRIAVRGDASVFQLSEISLFKADSIAGTFNKVGESEMIGNHPRHGSAPPAYYTYFNHEELHRTIILDLEEGEALKLMGKSFGPTTNPPCFLYGPGCEFIIRKID